MVSSLLIIRSFTSLIAMHAVAEKDQLGRMKSTEERVLVGRTFCSFDAGMHWVVILSKGQKAKDIVLGLN